MMGIIWPWGEARFGMVNLLAFTKVYGLDSGGGFIIGKD